MAPTPELRFYVAGVLWVVSVLVGLGLLRRHWPHGRWDEPGHYLALCLLFAFFGGAVSHLSKPLLYPREISDGYGHHFFGWAMGGALGVAVYARLRRLPVAPLFDSVALATLAASAIGRLACLVAGCCHGVRAEAPFGWAMHSPTHGPGSYVPTQLMQALIDATTFLLLRPRLGRSRPGALAVLAVWSYCGTRFVMEFVRVEPRVALGLTAPQWLALASSAIAAGCVWRARRAEPESHRSPSRAPLRSSE